MDLSETCSFAAAVAMAVTRRHTDTQMDAIIAVDLRAKDRECIEELVGPYLLQGTISAAISSALLLLLNCNHNNSRKEARQQQS